MSLYYDNKTGRRLNQRLLDRYDLTPDSEGIYPLGNNKPVHNSRLERCIDQLGVEGNPVTGFNITYRIEPYSLAVARNMFIDYCYRQKEAALKHVGSGYGEYEVKTWPQQQSEAESYHPAMHPSEVPILSAIAAARGLDLALMAEKVLSKVALNKGMTGLILGATQAAEDLVSLLDEDDANWRADLLQAWDEWDANWPAELRRLG